MSAYLKLGLRLALLLILVVGVYAMIQPKQAFALTCLQQCEQAHTACITACNNQVGVQDPSCIPDCWDEYLTCRAGC